MAVAKEVSELLKKYQTETPRESLL